MNPNNEAIAGACAEHTRRLLCQMAMDILTDAFDEGEQLSVNLERIVHVAAMRQAEDLTRGFQEILTVDSVLHSVRDRILQDLRAPAYGEALGGA